MAQKKKADQYFDGEEYWDSPSLAWIHRIRREMAVERAAAPPKPPTKAQIQRLAKKFSLRLLTPPSWVGSEAGRK
jgi:hypothetical protein